MLNKFMEWSLLTATDWLIKQGRDRDRDKDILEVRSRSCRQFS